MVYRGLGGGGGGGYTGGWGVVHRWLEDGIQVV